MGPLPPDLMPQILNDASLVEASAWGPISNLSLSLMMDGHVGSFTATIEGKTFTKNFDQKDLVQSLETPLIFVYSVPHDTGKMLLTLNLSNGYASLTFPHGGGPAVVRYSISPI
jgi:hypothetical protein